MARCVLHPGRESVGVVFNRNYCAICRDGIVSARGRVDRHVEPKDCFIWYVSNDNWQPITGTGCVHWVSHQRNIHAGGMGDCCLAGFTYRVPVLVRSRAPVADIGHVAVSDIWASPTLDHTGLVIRVAPLGAAAVQVLLFVTTPADRAVLRKTTSRRIFTVTVPSIGDSVSRVTEYRSNSATAGPLLLLPASLRTRQHRGRQADRQLAGNYRSRRPS